MMFRAIFAIVGLALGAPDGPVSYEPPPLSVGECRRVEPQLLLCRGGEDWYRLVEVSQQAVAAVARD